MKKPPKEQYKPAENLELNKIKIESPKAFRKVCCPSCEEEVSANNLNLQHKVAKCGRCNVIFSIEKEVESVKPGKEMKQEVLRPEGIDLFSYKEDLDITIQQHIQGLDAVGIIFFPALALCTIFLYFLGKHSISPYFPIAFSLGALYYIYKGITYSNNKTYININDKFLSITSRPKNLKKDKTYAADEIDQLYVTQNGSGYYTIHLVLNGLKGQKHEKLITVNSLSKAKYLEQEIEWYLNIEDREILEANV